MLMVPRLAGTTRVKLWLCTQVEPARAEQGILLHIDGQSPRTMPVTWRRTSVTVPDGSGVVALDLWYAAGDLDSLTPDTTYSITPRQNAEGERVRVRTLPDRVPSRASGKQLRVVLASCFDIARGKATPLGPNVGPDRLVPHLKFLCGDQVYLDLPIVENLPHAPEELYPRFLSKYLANWYHHHQGSGFGSFLQWGANLFLSDDHEFWNNSPYPFLFVQDSRARRPIRQRIYGDGARALFRTFQGDLEATTLRTFRIIDIGPSVTPDLSIAVLDARYHRDHQHAFAPTDLAATCTWIRNLRSPGVLVLSQPLFDHANERRSRRYDAYLTHFADYARLVRAMHGLRHDLLVLSGDNHGGRIARVKLPSERTIWEVISSPMALCKPWLSFHDDPPAQQFPAVPVPGCPQKPIDVCAPLVTRNHIASIDFVRDGTIDFDVRFLPLDRDRQPMRPRLASSLSPWESMQ